MPQPHTPPPVAATDHRIALPGGAIFARSWDPAGGGAAAPVLLMHDSLGCVELWRSFPQRLAEVTGRRVIAYDRLGFGRSDPHPGRLTVGFVAAEAETVVPRLCDALGVESFAACGHSVGGGMAIETAARHADRCRALVTIAAQAFVEDRTLEGIRAARQDFQDPANLARLARYHGDKARWVVDAWTETWLSPEFADWTVDAALAALRCPVLAIHGAEDEYGTAEHPRRIAAGRGTARLLPGVGHVPHREQEALVVDLVAGFLAE